MTGILNAANITFREHDSRLQTVPNYKKIIRNVTKPENSTTSRIGGEIDGNKLEKSPAVDHAMSSGEDTSDSECERRNNNNNKINCSNNNSVGYSNQNNNNFINSNDKKENGDKNVQDNDEKSVGRGETNEVW